jgi:hypothetical protein
MEVWERILVCISFFLVFFISILYLVNPDMNMIALFVILCTFLFMGSIVWLGETNNPSIPFLPSLWFPTHISLQTCFFISWIPMIVAISLILNTFRQLHAQAMEENKPIDLGMTKPTLDHFYTLLTIYIVLIYIFFMIMMFSNTFTIRMMTNYYNLFLIYVLVTFVYSFLACFYAYDISKRFSFSS